MDVSPGTLPGQCGSGEHSWYLLTAVPVALDAEKLKGERPLRKLPAERWETRRLQHGSSADQSPDTQQSASKTNVLDPPGVPRVESLTAWPCCTGNLSDRVLEMRRARPVSTSRGRPSAKGTPESLPCLHLWENDGSRWNSHLTSPGQPKRFQKRRELVPCASSLTPLSHQPYEMRPTLTPVCQVRKPSDKWG